MDRPNHINTVATCTFEKYAHRTLYEILQKEFPESEMRSFQSQTSAFLHRDYRISVSGDNQAFALWWDFMSLIFVEYVLVAPQCRNCGKGSMLLDELKKNKKLIILEVETHNTGLLEFYKANGFQTNNIDYEAVPLSNNPADKYYLMSFHRELTHSEFGEFIELIHAPEYQF